MLPPIRIVCDINYGSGFNHAARGLVRALETIGYSPETVSVVGAAVGGGIYQEPGDVDWFHKYVYRDTPLEDKINIVVLHPGMAGDFHTSIGDRYNIAYTTWETNALPKSQFMVNGEPRTIVGDLNKFDEIWVPSQWLKVLFEHEGVKPPVFVLPHALQLELLERAARRTTLPPGARTGFYFIGSWNDRKNPAAVLRAWFGTGWTPLDPVALRMHCVPPSRDLHHVEVASWTTQDAVKNLYEALGDRRTEVASFGIMTAPRRFDAIVDLHLANEVFVTASRGEGFNLGAAEAAACGNLVIATPHAAPCLVDAGAYFVELPERVVPITPMPECRGYELDQEWWDVASKDLVAAMREAVEDVAGETTLAFNTQVGLHSQAARLRDLWSPTSIGRLVKERLAL